MNLFKRRTPIGVDTALMKSLPAPAKESEVTDDIADLINKAMRQGRYEIALDLANIIRREAQECIANRI